MSVALVFLLFVVGCVSGMSWERLDLDLEVEPTDLAFAPNGTLFVTSASAGIVLSGTHAPVASEFDRPFGVAVRAGGEVCVAHFTSSDPLTRRSAISCRVGDVWTLEIEGVGSGLNGLVASEAGLWVAAWRDTPVESRDGLLSLVVKGSVVRQIELPGHVPQFVSVLPGGDLVVSAWREDASGFTGGAVYRVSVAGDVTVLDDRFARPSGVVPTADGIWIADLASGDLARLSEGGERELVSTGFAGPLGLALAPTGALCVAQSRANRVACFDVNDLRGGTR